MEKFRHVKTDGLPEFDNYDKPLEMGLWVLWVAKEKLDVRMLTAYEIADVIVNVMENSIDARAIVNAFNRAKGKKIHIHDIDGETYYEIMGPGKEHLIKKTGEGSIAVYYFEPGKRYQSKRVLATNILADLKGVLKIVDPYGDTGTLDILSKANVEDVQFLIRLDSLSEQNKRRFQRELQDFRSDHPNIKFRNYSKSEIHDRYIISSDKLIILGHSLKDLGSKESFAIKLDKQTAGDIFDTLIGTFNRRWKEASQL
ncbi:hypothetical protein MUP06_00205 [Patescibacteria group bacterium]|nr:hypothetical protein [Patescibacteria group bacterium]